MKPDGKGWLFAPTGLKDGPLPTHYEPVESIIQNPLYGQQANPKRIEWRRSDNPYHKPYGDPRFPYVVTTYRLTEHHTGGAMSRWLPWLSELQPEMFCEISPELARERNLKNGGWATIRTLRAEIEARVLVTRAHSVAAHPGPYHPPNRPALSLVERWTRARRCGERSHCVSWPIPNVSIQESKALTATIEPGRRRR